MVIIEETPGHVAVYVDTGNPTAWQREPYYSQLKTWARVGVERGIQVVVYIKNRAICILPNKEVDLGTYHAGDALIVRTINTSHGTDFEATLVRSDGAAEQHRERPRPRPQADAIATAQAA
jgi:hypothetical protein